MEELRENDHLVTPEQNHKEHQQGLRNGMRSVKNHRLGEKLTLQDYAKQLAIEGERGRGNIGEILRETEFLGG